MQLIITVLALMITGKFLSVMFPHLVRPSVRGGRDDPDAGPSGIPDYNGAIML